MNHLLDTNCKGKGCSFRLGISQAYNLYSSQRRQGLEHHGYKYIPPVFESINGKKIIEKIKERTIEAYPDVMTGKRRTIITSPPQFEYNSKLTATFSVVEEALEKIASEKLKGEDELKHINQFRADYLPQAGERDVFNPLLSCFFHNPGLFIHGFEPSKYLDVFVQQAEMMRNEELSKSIQAEVELWMKDIVKRFPTKEPLRVFGHVIKGAIEEVFKKKSLQERISRKFSSFSKKLFGASKNSMGQNLKEDQAYTKDEAKELLKYKLKANSEDESGISNESMEVIIKLFPVIGPLRHETIFGSNVKKALDTISKDKVEIQELAAKTKIKFKDDEKYTVEELDSRLLSCFK